MWLVEFIEVGIDDVVLDVQGIDQQVYGQCGGMLVVGGQVVEEGLLCSSVVEVEGLGIVLLGKLFDFFGVYGECVW